MPAPIRRPGTSLPSLAPFGMAPSTLPPARGVAAQVEPLPFPVLASPAAGFADSQVAFLALPDPAFRNLALAHVLPAQSRRPAAPAALPAPNPPRPAEPPPWIDLPRQLDLPLPVDPLREPPDPQFLQRLGPAFALRHALLPWRQRNGDIVILTATPAGFDRHSAFLSALFGPRIRPLPCPRLLIEAALLAHAGPGLVQAAEQRPSAIDSCRSLDRVGLTLWAAAITLSLIALAALRPDLAFGLLLGLTTLTLLSLTFLKIATAAAALRAPQETAPPLDRADLPTISLLVPLYGEAEIAPRLIRRLSALDYPRDRLDVIVLLEASDTATRSIIAGIDLPQWMRVIAVPDGRIRTKPRALNFGLDFTRGSIIGIYDAEDAPAPDQLLKVAATFANAPPRLGCLQGILDFYNPATNWIARCFTFEYSAWFRLFLPGLVRLGLPIPLGGTTLFLRRDAVMEVGAWDAHNVTEDADLGLRLARRGWHTGMLPSVTMEEANCRPVPWIKQRSRWTKGYLMTWLVHMRAPRTLLRDLGPRRFAAVQVLILGSLMQGIATPVLWSLWLVALGLPHPVLNLVDRETLLRLTPLLLGLNLLDFGLAALAMRRAGHRVPWPWLPLLKPYALLTSFAAAKALVEAVTRPFHWDKTKHGHFDSDAEPKP
jgi:cellulose synthase/poly-beta-1,6-N-acetylglucosamine synthase-like glycosyltransferase